MGFELEVGWVSGEGEVEGFGSWGGAVFDGEPELIVMGAEVEVGVAPGMEITRAAQVLSGEGPIGLSGVVDEEDGEGEGALQLAEVGEEGGDLEGGILVEAVEADEGIEDQQAGAMGVEGVGEAALVGGQVEAELIGEDEEDGQLGEVDLSGLGEALESSADLEGVILGGEEEDWTGLGDRESSEARGAGGDGEGDLEGEEGFTGLGGSAEDADGLVIPEAVDEPGGLLGRVWGEVSDLADA